ncbi:hypothetical protein SH449x_001379 [Pirellulaceae bacterium SH449]
MTKGWLTPVLVLLISFLIRWIAIAFASDAFQSDPDAYRSLAIELNATGIFGLNSHPTAFRPPLYPWLLSWGVTDVRSLSSLYLTICHASLGAATCLLTWHMVREIILSRKESFARARFISSESLLPLVAAGLVAIDPILIRQSQLVMTETLATFLTTLTLWLMINLWKTPKRSDFFVVGLALGLSALCRPTAIAWAGLFFALLLVYRVPRFRLKASSPFPNLTQLSLLCLGIAVVIVPWSVRNRAQLDRWILTTTHGGYTLLLANNDSLYDHIETTSGRDWDDTAFQSEWASKIQGVPELEQDHIANTLAWKTIRARPITFVKSCVVRLGWLWALWPNQSGILMRSAIGAWYGLVFAGAIWGVTLGFRKGNWPNTQSFLLPACCLILSLCAVHSIYWSNLRMRAVAMPAICVAAVFPLVLPFRSRQDEPVRGKE